ncbi:MAG: HAMP domain-containing protein [Myxococcales bacterium]|nr:HAMP domain-containing protein [Myxococcales bacterium]MDD9971111.1 HAMP domain-containing protein [Myxococcales bacterium]
MMTGRRRPLPFRVKLQLGMLAVGAVGVTLTAAAIGAYMLHHERAGSKLQYAHVATRTAESLASSLAFEDRAFAVRVLETLSADPAVLLSCLYRSDGVIFVTHPAGEVSRCRALVAQMSDTRQERFEVVETVWLDHLKRNRVGTLRLPFDLAPMERRLTRLLLISGLAALVALGVSLFVSTRLMRALTQPLSRLIKSSRQVAAADGYPSTLPRETDDELGELTDAFNRMVARLRERDRELEDSARAIEHNLEQKTLLLRELHHRTRNNMQIIKSTLDQRAGARPTTEVEELVRATTDRINALALLHSHLDQSRDLSRIEIQAYARDLLSTALRSHGSADRITLRLKGGDFPVLVDVAQPCGIILNELMTNALKHAFPSGREGNVSVVFQRLQRSVMQIVFSDDGVGACPDSLNANQHTLGVCTIRALVEHQLQGKVAFEASSPGVTCTIRFDESLHELRI